jgi:hypothetical protein
LPRSFLATLEIPGSKSRIQAAARAKSIFDL